MSRKDELKKIISDKVNKIEQIKWDADQLRNRSRNDISKYESGDEMKWKLMAEIADKLSSELSPLYAELDEITIAEYKNKH